MITLEEKTKETVSLFEAALGQSVPITRRSFLYQLAVSQSAIAVSIDKKAIDAVRENLATTASLDGLIEIGRQELERDPFSANPAVLAVDFHCLEGVVIPVGTKFNAEENGLTYSSTSTAVGVDGDIAQFEVVCDLSGAETTVVDNANISLQSPIVGVGAGYITSNVEVGTNAEGTEEYRTKVLDAIRAQGGGSNLWDYRLWAQEVQGVFRAFPYGGEFDSNGDNIGVPSSRTVFIKATTDIDEDGIAPQDLLDEVRDTIITDPATNRNRICLGVPNDTLFVKSITRSLLGVTVYGSGMAWPVDATDAVNSAVSNYLNNYTPSIDGLDPVAGRSQSITTVDMSNIVHDALYQYGVSALKVEMTIDSGATVVEEFLLSAGVLPKLNGNVIFL